MVNDIKSKETEFDEGAGSNSKTQKKDKNPNKKVKKKTSKQKPDEPDTELGSIKEVDETNEKDASRIRTADDEAPDQNSQKRSRIVNLRVPTQIVDDIDYWVDHRMYRSRSEFILSAIRFYLDYVEYKGSYNVRTFQRGQIEETPSERFERLRYMRGRQ